MIVITKQKFLDDNELKNLMSMAHQHRGTRDSIMIRLALYTGGRQSEVLEVKPSDVSGGAVTIYGKKNSNDRTIPLPADFYAELVEFIKNINATQKIFPISTRHFRRIWDSWRTNPRKGLHCTRHTMGVRLYKNCKDIKSVQTMLGHKSILNTQVYVDYVDGQERLKTATKGMWDMPFDEVA